MYLLRNVLLQGVLQDWKTFNNAVQGCGSGLFASEQLRVHVCNSRTTRTVMSKSPLVSILAPANVPTSHFDTP